MRSDYAQKAVDAVFERLGIDVFYSPVVGDPVPCKVLFSADDDLPTDFGGASRAVGRKTVLKVRAAEVSPVKKQTLTAGAVTYTILSQPTLSDTARLVYSFEASVT
ncbi:hypothetical protein LP7551_02071 [Roseibium album]|nr:hypothetical protein LP7551_02071 [Roseibium album]